MNQMNQMNQLPLEVWWLILGELKDDLRDLFLNMRVSKFFYQVVQDILFHCYKIKRFKEPSVFSERPRNVIKKTINISKVMQHSEPLDYFHLYCDREVVQEIDIIYRFITNFSANVPKDWVPSLESTNYLSYYFLTVPLFDQQPNLFYVDFKKKIQRFFTNQQECDLLKKFIETLERKTTFLRLYKTSPIEPSVYLLFQSSHS